MSDLQLTFRRRDVCEAIRANENAALKYFGPDDTFMDYPRTNIGCNVSESFQFFLRIKREIDKRVNRCNSTFNAPFFFLNSQSLSFFVKSALNILHRAIPYKFSTREFAVDTSTGEFSCYGTMNFDGAHDVRRKIH